MRSWKSFSTNFATLAARLSVTGATLIVTFVACRRMTGEEFGLWSILMWLNQLTNGFDLGFQLTLGNRLAALGSRGVDGETERRETFISILLLQVFLVAVYGCIILVAVPLVPWARLFKIADPLLIRQVVPLLPIIFFIMVGTLPVGLIWTVFFAYGEIKLASVLAGIFNIIQTLVFVVSAYTCNFTQVILIYFSCNIVIGAILTAYVFIRRKWSFTLLPLARITEIVRSMARVSFHAFWHTITAIISTILGPIVSGGIFGLVVAGEFNLFLKLFSFLVAAHMAIMAPVGPSVSLESHSGDWEAVRRRLRLWVYRVWPAYFLVLGAIIWCTHPFLIRLWAGHSLTRYPLAAVLLLWACLSGFVNTFSIFLNSLGLVKAQAALSMVMLVPSLLLPVLLSRWLGLPGVALSMALCLLPAAIIWPFYTRRALRLHIVRV